MAWCWWASMGIIRATKKARPNTLGMNSSSRSSRCFATAGGPCRGSTISIFHGTGRGRKRCTTRRATSGSRSWRGRAFPCRGASRHLGGRLWGPRARGRAAVHLAPEGGAVEGLQFRGADRGALGPVFHAEIPAYAGRAHYAGKFLQPAGQQHGKDVSYWQGAIPGGAHAVDHGVDG